MHHSGLQMLHLFSHRYDGVCYTSVIEAVHLSVRPSIMNISCKQNITDNLHIAFGVLFAKKMLRLTIKFKAIKLFGEITFTEDK